MGLSRALGREPKKEEIKAMENKPGEVENKMSTERPVINLTLTLEQQYLFQFMDEMIARQAKLEQLMDDLIKALGFHQSVEQTQLNQKV